MKGNKFVMGTVHSYGRWMKCFYLGIVCLVVCTGCSHDLPDKLFMQVLPEFTYGEEKPHSGNVHPRILIMNSEEDIKNSDFKQPFKDYIYAQNIDFEKLSLLVMPLMDIWIVKDRTYDFYLAEGGHYVLTIEHKVESFEQHPWYLTYLCVLVEHIEKDTKVVWQMSYK